ncbi:MAG: UDP-glucose 4-epimerase GalE [Myxococcales bacterium]|nr:MAG: UDP-glucose 4-epimerase GalE [Myxococcales bacterium]
MKILVTGGVGFVGSHLVWAAADAGHDLVVLDDFSGGVPAVLPDRVRVVRGDIGDAATLDAVLGDGVEAVVHFAGKIQVGESVRMPGPYFDTNFVKSLRLLEAIARHRIERLVFSSTAAVYGTPDLALIPETAPTVPVNPYGASKLSFEYALAGFERAHGVRWAALRYFNASGARRDGRLRENHEPETHLIPLVIDAGLGRRPPVTIMGTDYATRDGTCLRDYIHVEDLASAHLRAIDVLGRQTVGAANLGTGRGYTVREVVDAVGEVLGQPVPHTIGTRREGDPPALVADAARARQLLGWEPTRSELRLVVEDTLRSRR